MRAHPRNVRVHVKTTRNSPMKRNSPKKSTLIKSARHPTHHVPTSPRASTNGRSWTGSGNAAPFAHPADDRSLCQRCLERKNDDDEPCPIHPQCQVGMCQSHLPNWRLFCSQIPMTIEQRRIMKRWVLDIMPDLTPRQVEKLTDEERCALIRNMDLEWRRPLREPEQFVGCSGDEDLDYITYEPLNRVPHEVNGTFSLPDNNPKERCADIRGVVDWWRSRDKQHLPRTVPHFSRLDSSELRERIRNWAGRNKFFREHFATENELLAALNGQEALGATEPVHVDWAELYEDWNIQEANRAAVRDQLAAGGLTEPVWRAQWALQQTAWLQQQEHMSADDLETLHRAIERRFMDTGDDDSRLCILCADNERSIVHTGCRHCSICEVCYVRVAERQGWPAHVACIHCRVRSPAITIGEYTLAGNINNVILM